MSTGVSKMNHERWSSRLTFFLAALGVSVGLGNVWRFPYMAGENGGGAFILIYLACAFGIGVPLLMAELSIGRQGGLSPIGSMRAVALESGKSSYWSGVGVLAMVTLFLVLTFYMVVTGWTFDYFFQAVSGDFSGRVKVGIRSSVWWVDGEPVTDDILAGSGYQFGGIYRCPRA